jgi:four helix bundle protein
MKESIVKDKSMAFAIRIVNLYKFLCEKKKEFVMSKQILRCGTSIGANIAEAECAFSRKDFLAKIYIAFKECSETKYWLELLLRTEYINIKEYTDIAKDVEELYKILSAITKTTRGNSN